MSNPQDLKKAILAVLAEKGDYATLLQHLDTDEKKEKGERMYKLIEPISAFADMLTENSKGAFMEELGTRLDTTTKENLEKLSKDIANLREELREATTELLGTTKSELVAEHLARYQEAESALRDQLMQLAVEVVTAKSNEMFSTIAEGARLTEEEIEDIIEASALSVESQLEGLMSEYLATQKLTASQITDFSEAVRKLLPAERQVTWDSIVGKPDISQGGTSAVLVKRMIDEALDGFTPGSGVPPGGTTGQALIKQSNADGDADWASIPGDPVAFNDLTDVTVSATDPATADGTFWVDIS